MIETTVEAVASDAAGTVVPETPVSDAAQRLRDPAVPALVVLDGDRVAGIVTESDFVALVAETHEPVTVDAIMSTPVVTLPANTPVGLAADRMKDAGVKHLPIVDDEGYCGLVSLPSLAPFLSRTRLEVTWDGDPLRVDTASRSETSVGERSSDGMANG